MKRNILFLVRGALLATIILLLLLGMNRLMLPKFFYDETWAMSSTTLGFYQLPENSVEVLALGSSEMAADFVPQTLYDEYGITSYNLATDQQNLLISYYWLKEALEYQSPQVVILDTYLLHTYDDSSPLNSAEASQRRALDYMRWGKIKLQAALDISSLDSQQDFWSYTFTNIRYHERWKSMGRQDFSMKELETQTQLKGFVDMSHRISGYYEYAPFLQDLTEQERILPVMGEYLDRMVELCRERGIVLLLVKTPSLDQTPARSAAVELYARDNGLEFLDFNLVGNYEELGFDFSQDMADGAHANVMGAVKITRRLGELLLREYGLEPRQEEAWEETSPYFRRIYVRSVLETATDLAQYLTQVAQGPYTVFLSVNEEGSTGLTSRAVKAMRRLGFEPSLEGAFRSSYLALWDQGESMEMVSQGRLILEGTTQSGLEYSMASGGYQGGRYSSIVIEGKEFSQDLRGLNIVVYDHYFRKVIDSVTFDTADAQAPAIRVEE